MRALLCLALLLSAACQKAPPPGTEAKPAPVEVTVPEPVVRYVQASTLKLRAAPSPTGRVRGRLGINSPLEVLEEKDGFSRVRVRNGKEGWVGRDFLKDKPVTVAAARELAENAITLDVRLSWLQRAAALEPTNLEVLEELKVAYLLQKKTPAAEMVGRLIVKLKGVEAAAQGRLIAAYRQGLEWMELTDTTASPGPIPRGQWAALGLVDEAEIWALSADGPAVRVRPEQVRRDIWNECGGSVGVTVDVGATYALAHLGPPPASWSLVPTPWGKAELDGLKTQAATHCLKGWDCQVFAVANKGHGAFVRVLNQRDDPNDDMFEFAFIDLRATAPGAPLQKLREEKTGGYILGEPMPVALRDVVGDDAPEVIMQDDCSSTIRTLDGEVLFSSSFRCCGC